MNVNIQHLAKLARLRITPEEERQLEPRLSQVLSMMEQLPPLSGSDLPPDGTNPLQLRPDTVESSMERDVLLQNAPRTENGCIAVPRIVGE